MDIKNNLPSRNHSWQRISLKTLFALILSLVLLLSLVAPVVLSFYNRPYSDDYTYGVLAAHAWRDTKSIVSVLESAVKQVFATYKTWQGTFSAVFLFALQPGILSEKLYFLSTLLLMGSLISSKFIFLYVLLIGKLKSDRATWLIVSNILVFITVQFLPSASEGFYWYNGGVFYTFFYSLLLLLLSILIKSSSSQNFLQTIAAIVISVLVGGGNYITALLGVLLVSMYLLYLIITHSKGIWLTATCIILIIVGLYISAVAPGNEIRAQAMRAAGNHPVSIPQAILTSYQQGFLLIHNWASPWLISLLLLLIPLFKPLICNSTMQFRAPARVFLLSYSLFCAQLSPPVLMNVFGSGRHINIIYYSFVLFMGFIIFYCTGWFIRLAQRNNYVSTMVRQYANSAHAIWLKRIFASALVLTVVVGLGNRPSLSGLSYQILLSGEATQFAQDRDMRLVQYLDNDRSYVRVKPLSVQPALFLATDLWYEDWWVNQSIAHFYGKKSVAFVQYDLPLVRSPIVHAVPSTLHITLKWSAVKGALNYRVSRVDNQSFTVLRANIQDTFFTVDAHSSDEEYTFLVQAEMADGRFSSSNFKHLVKSQAQPLLSPYPNAFPSSDSVKLVWSRDPFVETYGVIRLYPNGRTKMVRRGLLGEEYIVKNLVPGEEYTFGVLSFTNGTWSQPDETHFVTVQLPPLHAEE